MSAATRMRVARGVVYAATLLACLWIPTKMVSNTYFGQIADFIDDGEALLHGIPPTVDAGTEVMPLIDPVSMPMIDLMHARRFVHDAPSVRDTWLTVYGVLALLFIMALGGLLGGPLGAAMAVGVVSWRYNVWPGPGCLAFMEFGLSLFVFLIGCLLVWRGRQPSTFRTVLLSLALGASLLYRSSLAFFPPFLILFELIFEHRRPFRSAWKMLLPLCLIPYLFLTPWIRMNWIAHGRLIPFENGEANRNIISGASGFILNNPPSGSVEQPAELPDPGNPNVLPWAIRRVLSQPLPYIRAYAARITFILNLQPVLFFFAFLAIWIHRDRREFRSLAALILYWPFIHCFMAIEPSYFVPLWPMLAIMAASLLDRLWGRMPPADRALEERGLMVIVLCGLAAALLLSADSIHKVNIYARRSQLSMTERREILNREIAVDPNDFWLRSIRGKTRLANRDFPGAVEDFTKALSPGVRKSVLTLHPDEIELDLQWAKLLAPGPEPLLQFQIPSASRDLAVRGLAYKMLILLNRGLTDEANACLHSAWVLWLEHERTHLSELAVAGGAGDELARVNEHNFAVFLVASVSLAQNKYPRAFFHFVRAVADFFPNNERLRPVFERVALRYQDQQPARGARDLPPPDGSLPAERRSVERPRGL